MPAPSFDYAVIRVVPRVDREEFRNAGVTVMQSERFSRGSIEFDRPPARAWPRWTGYHPAAPGGNPPASARERMPAPRQALDPGASTGRGPAEHDDQVSPVHTGFARHPNAP